MCGPLSAFLHLSRKTRAQGRPKERGNPRELEGPCGTARGEEREGGSGGERLWPAQAREKGVCAEVFVETKPRVLRPEV